MVVWHYFRWVVLTPLLMRWCLPYGIGSDSKEVRVCPFCRYPAGPKVRAYKENDGMWTVDCGQGICRANPTTPPFATREEAIAAWNEIVIANPCWTPLLLPNFIQKLRSKGAKDVDDGSVCPDIGSDK